MSRNLRLQVVLNAVDRATRPLRAIDRASTSTSQAIRENRDRLKQLQNTQKDVNSFRTLTRQSTNTTTALRQQQERVRRLSSQLRTHEGDSASLRAERDKAIVQARALSRRSDEERQKLQRLRSVLNNNGMSTAELARDQRRLTQDMRQATHAVEDQQRRLKRLAEQQRNAARARGQFDRTMSVRNQMAGTGAGMAASGGAAMYAGARLLAPGVAWGEQMSTLQAVGRFTADDERYQALRQQSRELGGSTAFSATEVGSGQEFLLRAGMSSEAIRASMRDVLDLALANNTELSRAADIASNIGGAFKIDLEADGSMARVADILSGTASRANVNLEMLGETMKYLGGAEDLKLTMEQAAAMSGVLGNIGVQGSQAGTTMRTMMNRLTNPAAKGAAAIENIGLQVADANGNMRAMPDILRDISQATADLGNVERKAIMQDIFGTEAGSGMAELVNSMGAGELDALLNALGENMGENARMAKTMADNIGGDLKNWGSAWEEVGISIADTNDGPLRDLIQRMTAITRGVGQWIRENPKLAGTIAKVAGTLAVLATAGGAITLMLASILGPIAMVRYAMALIGPQVMMAGKALLWLGGVFRAVSMFFLTNPIGLAIAAIAGAAYLIYRNWEPIKAFFNGLWQQVKDAFGAGLSGVSRLLVNWSPLGLLWAGISSALGRLGIELPGSLTALGARMIGGLSSGITAAIGTAHQAAARLWSTMTGAFESGIGSVSRLLLNWSPLGLIWAGISSALGRMGVELPGSLTAMGARMIKGLTSGITGTIGTVRQATSRLWFTLTGAFDQGIGGVTALLLNWSPLGLLWAGISSAIGRLGIELPGSLTALGSRMIAGLTNGISGAIGTVRQATGRLWSTLTGAFDQGIGGVTALLLNWSPLGLLWAGISSALARLGVELPSSLTALGSRMIEGLTSGIRGAISTARQATGQLWSAITGAFDGGVAGVTQLLMNWSPLGLLYNSVTAGLSALGVEIPEQFRSLGSAMVSGLMAGLTGKLGELRDSVAGMAGSVRNWFADVLGINSPSRVFIELGGFTVDGLISGLSGKLAALRDRVTSMAGSVRSWFADVLDINSPSRVFTQLGGYTVDGLNKGLDAQRDQPARRVADIARRVTRAGAGLAIGAAALPAAAMPSIEQHAPIQFDSRPPLTASNTQAAPGVSMGDININVTPAPGMDERQLAQYVAQEVQRALDNAQRDAQARQRSSMRDLD